MRIRPVAAGVLLLGVVVAVPTNAATKPKPKPLCGLLADDKGDGHLGVLPLVTSPALDVVGGDVGTGSKTMVAVLRLASTDMSLGSDKWSSTGYSWTFGVTSTLGQSYMFSAARHVDGSMDEGATVDGVSVPFSFKVVGNTFVWTIQRKVSPNLARPRNVFHEFRGGSEVENMSADSAFTKESKYPDRALSCVSAS